MKYITKHLLLILVTIITMFPVTGSSVTVTVDGALRSMIVGNLGVNKFYTGTGLYAPSPAYAYPSSTIMRAYGGRNL